MPRLAVLLTLLPLTFSYCCPQLTVELSIVKDKEFEELTQCKLVAEKFGIGAFSFNKETNQLTHRVEFGFRNHPATKASQRLYLLSRGTQLVKVEAINTSDTQQEVVIDDIINRVFPRDSYETVNKSVIEDFRTLLKPHAKDLPIIIAFSLLINAALAVAFIYDKNRSRDSIIMKTALFSIMTGINVYAMFGAIRHYIKGKKALSQLLKLLQTAVTYDVGADADELLNDELIDVYNDSSKKIILEPGDQLNSAVLVKNKHVKNRWKDPFSRHLSQRERTS